GGLTAEKSHAFGSPPGPGGDLAGDQAELNRVGELSAAGVQIMRIEALVGARPGTTLEKQQPAHPRPAVAGKKRRAQRAGNAQTGGHSIAFRTESVMSRVSGA